MGLDIMLFKTRHQKGDDLTEENFRSIIESERARSNSELARDYCKCIKILTEAETNKVDSDTYTKLYKECIDSIKKHFSYPEYSLNKIGYSKEYVNDMGCHIDVYKPVPVETWIQEIAPIMDMHYVPSVCDFRKVNLLFAYFENEGLMLDSYFAFMDKETCLDIIDRCKRVLEDHSLASELLPTQSGFFFGSTDYDKWYYNDVEDVLKQLTEKALPVYDESCWEKGQVSETYENEKMNTYWIFSW